MMMQKEKTGTDIKTNRQTETTKIREGWGGGV